MKCKTCIYYVKQDRPFGICKKRAPVLQPGKDFGVWPTVTEDQDCGEWKYKMEDDEYECPNCHNIFNKTVKQHTCAGGCISTIATTTGGGK